MEVCSRSSVVLSFGGGIGWGGGRGRCGTSFPGEEGSQESYLRGEDRKNFKNEDGALYSHVLPRKQFVNQMQSVLSRLEPRTSVGGSTFPRSIFGASFLSLEAG